MKASIVIPSYNAKERLNNNLQALNKQDYKGDDVEVIVVDNGSNDDTASLVKNYKLKYPLSLVLIEQNKGIANARNQGILKAKGDIIVFHDSDMIAKEDFISNHIAAHKDDNTVVCGIFWKRIYTFYYNKFNEEHLLCLKNYVPDTRLKQLDNKDGIIPDLKFKSFKDLEKLSFDLNNDFVLGAKEILKKYHSILNNYIMPWRFFITNNLSVSRKKIVEVGMLDDKIIKYGFEDYDLGYRLYKSGCKFVFSEAITSLHQEHPHYGNYLDAIENINYICSKYDNIRHIDFHLVCLGGLVQLNGDQLDDIVSEIDMLNEKNRYTKVLKLYLYLLNTVRQKSFDTSKYNHEEEGMRVSQYVIDTIPELVELRTKLIADNLVKHLCLLTRVLFGIILD